MSSAHLLLLATIIAVSQSCIIFCNHQICCGKSTPFDSAGASTSPAMPVLTRTSEDVKNCQLELTEASAAASKGNCISYCGYTFCCGSSASPAESEQPSQSRASRIPLSA